MILVVLVVIVFIVAIRAAVVIHCPVHFHGVFLQEVGILFRNRSELRISVGQIALGFQLAVIVAAVLVLAVLRLPETLPAGERVALRLGSVVSGYARLLSLRGFVMISLTLGLALGAIFGFITVS